MKFVNDRILRDLTVELFNKYGRNGLLSKLDKLEERILKLETRKPVGRPRKNAENDETGA